MQKIFNPEFVMRGELLEAWDCGLTRIEISYYASSILAEEEFDLSEFDKQAECLINIVKEVINSFSGLVYTVPTLEFLTILQDECKSNQMYFE